MNRLNTRQIHTEHQQALMLCDDITEFVNHFDEQDSYFSFQESIDDLRHLLINIHCPRERQLTRHMGSRASQLLQDACPDDRHADSIACVNRLDELVHAAINGTLVKKTDITDQAHNTVDRISRLIDLEERSCLPRVTDIDTGPDHEA